MQYDYIKGLGYRFLRGFVAGAISFMASVTIVIPSWHDALTVLSALGLVGMVGGLTGGLLAADKYLRTSADENTGEAGRP